MENECIQKYFAFEYIFKKGFIMGFNEAFASKIYIGDSGGQAQMIVGQFGVHKYEGNVKELSVARANALATTVGNYALFGGGWINSGDFSITTVEAYDTSLTRTIPTEFKYGRYLSGVTTVGNYALFGGGVNAYGTVDAYDTSLTGTTAPSLSKSSERLEATTVGDHALFAGGINNGFLAVSTVDAYNSSLTKTTATSLSVARYGLAATTVGNYALFGGGGEDDAKVYDTVDAYYAI